MRSIRNPLNHGTGLDIKDESWTWSDLTRELSARYKISDLSELVYLLEERHPGILKYLGYIKT